MAILERLPTPQAERLPLLKRLPGVRGLLAKEVQIEPIKKLEELAAEIKREDDDTIEMVYELDNIAEEVLSEIEGQQYSTLNQVWAAANAWDASRVEAAKDARTEHVDALMDYVMDRTDPLAGRDALGKAYSRAKRSGRSFDEELDEFNREVQEKAKEALKAAS